MLAIAADGNTVLTERLNRMLKLDGSEVGRFRVMGAFEVENDRILAWRDYFDTAGTQPIMQRLSARFFSNPRDLRTTREAGHA